MPVGITTAVREAPRAEPSTALAAGQRKATVEIVKRGPALFAGAPEREDVVHDLESDGGRGLGSGRHYSPRHGMPLNSRNEGSKGVSMTWRAISARPDRGPLVQVQNLLDARELGLELLTLLRQLRRQNLHGTGEARRGAWSIIY